MGKRGRPRPSFVFIEKSVPDRQRVESGLRILARLIAEAHARERAAQLDGNGAATAIPQEEVSSVPSEE